MDRHRGGGRSRADRIVEAGGLVLPVGSIPADEYALVRSGSSIIGRRIGLTYLPTAQPTGMSTAAVGRWKLNGEAGCLNDLGTGGNNLTLINGGTTVNPYYGRASNGLVGWQAVGTQALQKSNPGASLRIVGALTIETIVTVTSGGQPGNKQTILGTGKVGASELQTDNVLYEFSLYEQCNWLQYRHEHGAGTDDTANFLVSVPAGTHYIGMYRKATGETRGMIDGYLIAEEKAALTMPDGGDSASLVFELGRSSEGGGAPFTGIIHDIRITPAVFSAAQFLEVYGEVS